MSTYPINYLRVNEEQTKQLNVVLEIADLGVSYALLPTSKRITYGMPGIAYGDPGLVYGGLIPDDTVMPWLSVDSSLTISQRLEPEQGRASISQMVIAIIDKNGEVSKMVSPGGGVLPEILGREVVIRLGYANTGYPEDYFSVFRGIITDVLIQAGKVTLTFGDAGQKRRSAVFLKAKTTLTGSISDTDLTIPVVSTGGFPLPFQQPDGSFDSSITAYLRIEDEYISLADTGHTSTSFAALARGQRDTAAIPHAAGLDASCAVEFTGNALILALKIMLSGFDNYYASNILPIYLGQITDTSIPNALNTIIVSEDAVDAWGVAIGDWVTIDSSSAGNNGTFKVTGFGDNFGVPNTIIYIDTNLNAEVGGGIINIYFQSQFNTFPKTCGLQIPSRLVEIDHILDVKNNYFAGTENNFSFFMTDQTSGKEFIEKELFYPLGAYSLSRFGKLSVGYTRPPIPGQFLVYLDSTNVLDPAGITQQRGLNTRKFFNEIQFEYDFNYLIGNFQRVVREVDTESLSLIGLRSMLPIQARGVTAANGGGILASRTTRRMLSRYTRGALIISLKTMWRTGSLIEAGDVVVLTDNGTLYLTNPNTGERDLGQALFEVTDRSIDVKSGIVSLKLISGLESTLTDRYGTISPSSLITASGTNYNRLHLKQSFGETGSAGLKWANYIGAKVIVRNADFSQSAETVIASIPATNPDLLEISPALPFLPGEDYVVEFVYYDDSSAASQSLEKLLHAYLTPTVVTTTAPSGSSFDVASGDAAKFFPGAPIVFFTSDFGSVSLEATVDSIAGTTLYYSGAASWSGTAGDQVGLIGFAGDLGGPYRLL